MRSQAGSKLDSDLASWQKAMYQGTFHGKVVGRMLITSARSAVQIQASDVLHSFNSPDREPVALVAVRAEASVK